MKLSHFLPTVLLATCPYASAEEPQNETPKVEDPIPVGELWTAKWDNAALQAYTQHCRNKNTYTAETFKLSELYPTLKDHAPSLKIFYNKQHYAGSWAGHDAHGVQRDLLRMPLSSLPFKVRSWLKSNPTQKHYSVQEDVVYFAPGAIYPILPLWVDDADEEECEDVFEDLERYANELGEGRVVGKVSHREGGKNEVEFGVEALVVGKKREGRDEL